MLSCEVYLCLHVQETGWQSDMRLRIMPGLPKHIVQELNASTVESVPLTIPAHLLMVHIDLLQFLSHVLSSKGVLLLAFLGS